MPTATPGRNAAAGHGANSSPEAGEHGVLTIGLLVTLLVALLLGGFATAVAVSQGQSRNASANNFRVREQATAAFVGDYIAGLARNERTIATTDLAGSAPSPDSFADDNVAFGFVDAFVLGTGGSTLLSTPGGSTLATTARGLETSSSARPFISAAIPERGGPVVVVAVPFGSGSGRHVYGGAFRIATTPLGVYLDHAIVAKEHNVYLEDSSGELIAAAPATNGRTLVGATPALALALRGQRNGSSTGSHGPLTYSSSTVPGTSWRLVIAEANTVLYRSTLGFAGIAPWLIFVALVAASVALIGVFLRALLDRRALAHLSVQLAVAVETDELTALPNRRRLVRALNEATTGNDGAAGITLLLLDFDNFKAVNDGFGHDAGDRALIAVGDVMRAVLGESDIFGRWGGDEFVAILSSANAARATTVADQLQTALHASRIDTGRGTVELRVSIGIASGLDDVDELLRRADFALYDAKAAGGASVADQRTAEVRA